MAVIGWGKPKIEICAFEAGGTFPVSPTWTEITPVVKDSSQLTTEDGEKLEALEEGGGVIDTKKEKSKFSFVCALLKTKTFTKPITDADGVVALNYAIRVTPEDSDVKGWIMDKTSVSAKETWTSKDGGKVEYTFDGLVPESGNILKEYDGSGA